MRNEILISFIIFTILHTGLTWRPYKFRITSAQGECIDNQCNLTVTLNKTSLEFGFDFTTNHRFDPFFLNIILYIINADKTEKMMFNKSIDICAFLENKTSDQLFTILYNDMKNYGHLITKCPLNGNFYIKKYVVDTEKLPPFMPLMKTRTEVMMTGRLPDTKRNVIIAKITIIGIIDNSAGVNRLIKING